MPFSALVHDRVCPLPPSSYLIFFYHRQGQAANLIRRPMQRKTKTSGSCFRTSIFTGNVWLSSLATRHVEPDRTSSAYGCESSMERTPQELSIPLMGRIQVCFPFALSFFFVSLKSSKSGADTASNATASSPPPRSQRGWRSRKRRRCDIQGTRSSGKKPREY